MSTLVLVLFWYWLVTKILSIFCAKHFYLFLKFINQKCFKAFVVLNNYYERQLRQIEINEKEDKEKIDKP